tara:strand:- start:1071 stop:5081 length:4011 start_codon:yes stop_codon:yes gene_type:complete
LKYKLIYILLITQVVYSQQFRNVTNISDLNSFMGNNGVAVADYDLDGDLDIFIVSARSDDNDSNLSRLLQNTNNGNFLDVTSDSGINQNLIHEIDLINYDENGEFSFDTIEHGDRLSASWGDFNNDGYPDLFLGNAVQSELYKNNGNGTFTNITESAGFQTYCEECYITGALWLDYDLDGFLDIFLSDYNQISANKLYRNLGNETFEQIDLSTFLDNANSFSALPIYANEDMYPDIYIANDFDQHNQLLINQGGSGFIEMAIDFGVEDPYDGMGLTTCDFNNDLDIDFFVTNIKENSLYTKDAIGATTAYTNYSEQANLYDTDWAWGVTFSDFNHDGYEDFYVANGFFNPEDDRFFINDSGISFTYGNFSGNPPLMSKSRSVNSFDYDNDGDLDLIVTDFNLNVNLWENKAVDSYFSESILGSWVKFNLEGTISNRDALGSIIQVDFQDGSSQIRQYTGSGYQNQSIQSIHFGGSVNNVITAVTIYWPNSEPETYNNISTNSTYKIVEGEGIEQLENNTAVKIEGCTDENSCSYDPEATLDDNSCIYIDSFEIVGENIVQPLESHFYNYYDESIVSYEWEVENGTIISGNGTPEVEVLWDIAETGLLSLSANGEECSTDIIEFEVSIQLPTSYDEYSYSIARLWNEVLLFSIRNDLARPTVHARNLFHISAGMYDSWAIVNEKGSPYLIGNSLNGFDSDFDSFSSTDALNESNLKAISYAAYRMINHRFSNSPGYERIQFKSKLLMNLLGLDINYLESENYNTNPKDLGNYIAETYIEYGLVDGSNEQADYKNQYYLPVNEPLTPIFSGNPTITNPNRWQPLTLDVFVDQSGNVLSETTPEFLGAEWGNVWPFGLSYEDMTEFERDGNIYKVFHDPGSPPLIDQNQNTNELFIEAFSMVSVWGSHLTPEDDTIWDISPNSIGNVDDQTYPQDFNNYTDFYSYYTGGDTGQGYSTNPVTNETYEVQNVKRGDYTRVLAEYWADGPDSETPPGHWFVLLNSINDNPELEKKFKGQGDELSDLEWDIKSYFLLGGVMHDVAVSVWGIKGWYDYVRPISAIRYFSELGQSTDSSLENFDENGFKLIDGLIEVVETGDPLAGDDNENLGKIKLYTWKGHNYIENTETEYAGVDWILAENWWPYQRPTFVTPNFAGYVSGHSTYSRAAAEMLKNFTGSPYFPGGLETHTAKQKEFLVFEDGPSQDILLQWVSYKDAADQCSLSRIWGGIHPYIDDIPGRLIGQVIGNDSFEFGAEYFEDSLSNNEIIKSNLKLFSNPVRIGEMIKILNTDGSENFKIYSLTGQEIPIDLNYLSGSIEIPTNFLTRGVYILKSDEITFKVIIR